MCLVLRVPFILTDHVVELAVSPVACFAGYGKAICGVEPHIRPKDLSARAWLNVPRRSPGDEVRGAVHEVVFWLFQNLRDKGNQNGRLSSCTQMTPTLGRL